ncbi:F-box/LRR-repeat protein 3 [Hibiscus syriacus]|uniref:F-box/LRR-repeat protein 3 n=1 Tax=Hibiscus syriacus TaxID=106335 RepID=A0A6A3B8T0_HIBSY|nr:F-box/LRR-repeat protein 3 [Hibiscus syriacus]
MKFQSKRIHHHPHSPLSSSNPFDVLTEEISLAIADLSGLYAQSSSPEHFIATLLSRFFTNAGLSSLFVNCSGLVEVDLSNATHLTDLAASAIAEARNLERLSLARCKLITDMGIGCIAVGCRKLKSLCLKWCLRVGDLGVELIALKCKQIQSLDPSYLPITEKCLNSVLELQNLEDLVLEGCNGIDDDGLSTLEQSCKSLKMLNLSNCQNVTHTGLSSLINGTEQLQQIILAYGSSVTSDLAKCLYTYLKLQSIKLDGCIITWSGIKAMACLRAPIKELSFSKCIGLTDDGFSSLVQSHKDLRKLDITCCRKITYTSIDSITSLCTSLTSFRMESCSLVPKEAFVLIGERCSFLEELDATDNEIDDEGLKSISRCSKLSILKLGICSNISDEGLAKVGSRCSQLKELDLYRSTAVSDTAIAAIADGCPALEMINIAYNDKITDKSLISLSKCGMLKALEIRGCLGVSSTGVSAIAVGCKQIAVLDIKKCFNINDNGMLSVAQFSQNLKQINLSYCSVTDVGLVALASLSRLQNMTILHLAGLTPNGLAAALLACRALTKVKLHASFRPLLSQSILGYMEAHGCVFHWRDKAFQALGEARRLEESLRPPRRQRVHEAAIQLSEAARGDEAMLLAIHQRRGTHAQGTVGFTFKRPETEHLVPPTGIVMGESENTKSKTSASELQKFAIRVLSLTCSVTSCERNWSVFQQLHSKRRNRLTQSRLNGMVYAKFNCVLRRRYQRKDTTDPILLKEIDESNEWLMDHMDDEDGEEDDFVFDGDNLHGMMLIKLPGHLKLLIPLEEHLHQVHQEIEERVLPKPPLVEGPTGLNLIDEEDEEIEQDIGLSEDDGEEEVHGIDVDDDDDEDEF